MTFDASKPDSAESPDQFPAQCQANWSRLETMVGANHIFNNGADASDGKHKFVVMPEQSAAPTTAVDEMALYTKETDSITELFLRREGDGAEIQLTAGANTDTTAQATRGYSALPGGLLIQWGTETLTSTQNKQITFPKAFNAAASSVYSVVAQMDRNSTNVDTAYVHTIVSATFFLKNTRSSNTTAYWIAIGLA